MLFLLLLLKHLCGCGICCWTLTQSWLLMIYIYSRVTSNGEHWCFCGFWCRPWPMVMLEYILLILICLFLCLLHLGYFCLSLNMDAGVHWCCSSQSCYHNCTTVDIEIGAIYRLLLWKAHNSYGLLALWQQISSCHIANIQQHIYLIYFSPEGAVKSLSGQEGRSWYDVI